MKVLVTGATGFVGSHIAERLAAGGHEVRVLLRSTSSRRFLEGVPFEEALGDLTDAASLGPAARGVDAVIHAAGLVKARSAREFQAVNAQGTANLLDAVKREAPGLKRFVYVSSLAAHGPSPDGAPRPLDAALKPVSVYGRAKAEGEALVRRSPLADRAVMLRLPAVYGPKDFALLSFFKLVKLRFAPLLHGGRNTLSIIYAEDAARAAADLATSSAAVGGKAYTADDGWRYTWRDLVAHVEAAMGRKALVLPMPLWSYWLAGFASEVFGALIRKATPLSRDKVVEMRQRYWICSNQAIEADLGWRPHISFGDGARRTAAWYREQGLL